MKLTIGPLGDNEAISFVHGGQWTPSIIELWMAAERDGLDEFARESPKLTIDEARNELYLRRLEAKNILDHIPAKMLIDALFKRAMLPPWDPLWQELSPHVVPGAAYEGSRALVLTREPQDWPTQRRPDTV